MPPTAGPGRTSWRFANFLFPFWTQQPQGEFASHIHARAWVPLDDTHTMFYSLWWKAGSSVGRPRPPLKNGKPIGGDDPNLDFLPNTTGWLSRWRLAANESNDWRLDRDAQDRNVIYSGIPNIHLQDQAVTESMGWVADHAFEHLAPSDQMITRTRRRLLMAARALRENDALPPGVENTDVFRDARSGYFTTDDRRPWQKIYASQLAASMRPPGSRCAKGLKDGLGDKAASMIVAEDAYEIAEPTIDSHAVKMKSLNADVFVDITGPKFAAQAIRKAAEIGWKPLHFLNSPSTSVGAVIKPAGFENAQGIISVAYLMDALDPQWKDDPGMKAFDEFLAKDFPEGNRADSMVMTGFNVAQTLVQVLTQCGNDLTRENVMRQAANLKDFRTTNLLPGIRINTSPIDFAPIKQVQLRKFKGQTWELFGPMLSSEAGG
jgi:hypothetical protein